MSAPTAAGAEGLLVTPVDGIGRIETAIEASVLAFPAGAEDVIIATSRNWPDALGGSALAGVLDAPILLTEPGELPAAVAAEIDRLNATKAYILGGTGAVTVEVEAALDALENVSVERLAGDTRYDTACTVAQKAIDLQEGTYQGYAFVATGADFPDALGASPLAFAGRAPIYLADPALGDNAALVSTMLEAGVTRVIVLGGPDAVSPLVFDALSAGLPPRSVSRCAGENRYETAVQVAGLGASDWLGLTYDGVAIATGQNFPDALAGGVLQGRSGSVMLLTPTAYLDGWVSLELQHYAAQINEVRFLGGTGAISPAVRTAVTDILQE
ncbi:MAG: cell wall-binding repeat-containing protein [Coriobacteriia bacterium]|nr:cell wall-binding repeat-containing protein [Coriobacteriia bacterium]MBN2847315.1 cell wall-binding repeat-containing protein [Coriobacteriia bacterium]